MELNTIIGLVVVGLAAGVLSSMVGIGGGIVIVPCLTILFGLNQKTAQGTTLALLSLPVSLAATYSYYKSGHVDWRIALVLAIGFVVGGFFGGKFAVNVPQAIIKKGFAILMIIIAFKFLFIDKEKPKVSEDSNIEIPK
jgi:uncharacterized membrane protein YfcA